MSQDALLQEMLELLPEQIVPLLMSAAKKQPHCSKVSLRVLLLELRSVLQEADEGRNAGAWAHHDDGGGQVTG